MYWTPVVFIFSTDSADTEPVAKRIKPSVTVSPSCDAETEKKLSVDSNCDNTVNMDEVTHTLIISCVLV